MVTLNTTPNRAYQEPFLGNELSIDIGRLVAALRAIDTDMAAAFAQIVAKASLASPSFTGVPTVPTAAPGTDTGQAASTAFVRAAIAALVDSSPGALDTLNELAAALGDDPNFSTTVLTAIGLKADAAATTAALAGKQPLDAMLTALAALTSANGKFLAFSGADSPALRDIVGTVSQSGGTPTGAIFERGSNANGEYVRYADGTQICTFTRTVSFTTSTAGNIHRDTSSFGNWTLPVAFASNPFVVATAIGTNPWGGVSGITTTTATIILFSAIALSGASVTMTLQATGRWF